MVEKLIGHTLGHINSAVILVDFDTTNVFRIDLRLVGNRTDDVAGLHLMLVAHLDTVTQHPLVGPGLVLLTLVSLTRLAFRALSNRPGFAFARGPVWPLLTLREERRHEACNQISRPTHDA